jgi:hypothetical protein
MGRPKLSTQSWMVSPWSLKECELQWWLEVGVWNFFPKKETNPGSDPACAKAFPELAASVNPRIMKQFRTIPEPLKKVNIPAIAP